MDFGRVLDAVIVCLDRHDAPYALIGGLGMAAYGMPRTTLDVDFVVPGDVQKALVTYLENLEEIRRYLDAYGLVDRYAEIERTL